MINDTSNGYCTDIHSDNHCICVQFLLPLPLVSLMYQHPKRRKIIYGMCPKGRTGLI